MNILKKQVAAALIGWGAHAVMDLGVSVLRSTLHRSLVWKPEIKATAWKSAVPVLPLLTGLNALESRLTQTEIETMWGTDTESFPEKEGGDKEMRWERPLPWEALQAEIGLPPMPPPHHPPYPHPGPPHHPPHPHPGPPHGPGFDEPVPPHVLLAQGQQILWETLQQALQEIEALRAEVGALHKNR
jgi:hypothetical protein